MISNNYGAQYGFAPSAVVSIQTQSGTDKYHGTLFEFLRNNDLNAGNYFTGLVDPLKRNQFGGALGSDRSGSNMFFFVNYQATRLAWRRRRTRPSRRRRQCCRAISARCRSRWAALFKPLNGKPNQVNPALFSPGALAMAKVMPVGQDPGSGEVNYSGPAYRVSYDEGTGRLDYALSDKQHMVLEGISF